MQKWLTFAKKVDLHGKKGYGDGSFTDFRGVVLHVNVDRHGTPDSFWGPNTAVPNFQVFPDGTVHQLLPLDERPWCQKDGNEHYAAIETAGMPGDPLTVQQCASIAKILWAYHAQLGLVMKVVDKPGQRGLITHQDGGIAWGGHACPGPKRSAQRRGLLKAAKAYGKTPRHAAPAKPKPPVKPAPKPAAPKPAPKPAPAPIPVRSDPEMLLVREPSGGIYLVHGSAVTWVATPADYRALAARLGPFVQLSDRQWFELKKAVV